MLFVFIHAFALCLRNLFFFGVTYNQLFSFPPLSSCPYGFQYLLHDGDGWEDIANFFDLKISINSDVDQCVERLKIRNLVIPGYTPEEIEIRCEVVDRVNAMTVLQSRHRADVTVDAYSLKK